MTDFYRFLSKAFLLFLFLAIISSCAPREFEQPNIVLIMADDLGFGDIGCYGNTDISTPFIDRLAAEGIRFTDFHSNGAVCSPTRAALLTGRYQQRSGLEGVIYARGETRQTGLAIEETTIADLLKDAGYATGIVGKWHLGYRIDFNPIYQGFDYFRGYVSGNVDYHSHVDGAGVPDWWHNLEKTEEEGYVTDLVTDYAIEFIEKNHEQQFFLYVAHEAPHYPFQGRKDKADRFAGKNFVAHGSRKDKKGAYKEMIEVMDEGIGKIMTTLDELELSDKTMVIFCSDNGGLGEVADNGGLRGSKGRLWEGGHRVPAIVRWPGYILPSSVSHEIVLSMDFLPTFANLSKTFTNENYRFDGIDITRHLIEEKPLPERTVYWRYRDQKVARYKEWKLIVDKDSIHLYDLAEDLSEEVDLVNLADEVVQQLQQDLSEWEADIDRGIELRTQ
jgi:arylsulfatase A-like enzyme